MGKTKPEWENEAFATSTVLYKVYNTGCDNARSLSQWSRPQCAKYFNRWNKNRQRKLGMTWRSLPQGDYFCFAHPLDRLTSIFPVCIKESCIPKMIIFFFFLKGQEKKRKGVRINKWYQPVVCACALVLLPRTTLAAYFQICLLWTAGSSAVVGRGLFCKSPWFHPS